MKIRSFCCLGDSITSDQVTGIGTVVARKLGAKEWFNAACGYATLTDWHDGERNITPVTLAEPPNTNTADNVLSNQVLRVLQALTPAGQPITWTVAGREYALPPEVGLGTGWLEQPTAIYIAVSTNDGNQSFNTPEDDYDRAAPLAYHELTRCGMASALRWAVMTLRAACPEAAIFAASPLQTYTDMPWMSHESGLIKREVIRRVCHLEGVHFIDSFYGSGFDREVARDHGEVHPDEKWKERIACYVAGEIAGVLKQNA